jgi:hypothetical protein
MTPLPAGNYSPDVIDGTSASALGRFIDLMRKPEAFTLGTFAPMNPIAPVPIDRTNPQGRTAPRRFQYPVGFNLPTPPGATKLVDFQVLRNLADVHDITRRCIERRKQEISSLDWEITVKTKDKKAKRGLLEQNADAIEEITEFFSRPDAANGLSFTAWMKQALEEFFVIDALALYPAPTWGARAGLQSVPRLAGLEVLDGTTIKPLLDLRGGRPQPPNPAYQQFLFGFPRSEFTASDPELEITDEERQALADKGIVTSFTADQLMYEPYVQRSWTPYGFPPTEQIILAIDLALKRQQWHRSYFTDSSLPAGFIHAPESWTPTQIQQYQDAFDALLQGDVTWRRRIKVVPGGENFEVLKPEQEAHNIEFDEFLVRLVCLGFDMSPQEIGFPPRGQGLGGSGAAVTQVEAARRASNEPIARWFKQEIFDRVIAVQFGRTDLQWRWIGLTEENAKEEADIEHQRLTSAQITLNQWRIDHDLEPYAFPEADKPFILAGSTLIYLEGYLDRQKEQDALAADQAQTEMQIAKKPPLDPNRKPAPNVVKSIELARWRRKALKSLRDGRGAAVRFESALLSEDERALVSADLAKAATRDDVLAAFDRVGVEEDRHPRWLQELGTELEDFHREQGALAQEGLAPEPELPRDAITTARDA